MSRTVKTAECYYCGEKIVWVGGLIGEWQHVDEHYPSPKDGTVAEREEEE